MTVTASIVLKARNGNLLESYVASTQDPSSPNYHKFVSLPTFVANCGAAPSDIALLKTYLSSFNIQMTDVYADQLLVKATGTVDAFNKAFLLDIDDYVQGAQTFHRASNSPQIPFFLRNILVTVFGPTNAPSMRSMLMKTISGKHPAVAHALPSSIATGTPGNYTVGDVANLYDINPLYQAKIDGHGQTIGIATLADFLPSDAYAYWSAIGLKVLANRITQVHVDGGGLLSADAGTDETCLDVEQSGGLAPAAKIIVYDAPNTDPGFVDLFYKAASDNLVDSLSVSWGGAELYYYADVSGGAGSSAEFVAFHQAFLELAAQGISTFTASADQGAYVANYAGFNEPVNNVISAGFPGSDPAITSAGGTTVPWSGSAESLGLPPSAPPVTIYKEQVWGWSYLQSYYDLYGGSVYQDLFFPTGSGGGVSTYWPVPAYQSGVPGIRLTEAHQSVYYFGVDLFDLPAGFAGRNSPDISLNADPYSGYSLYCTQDGGLIDDYGGTSFVAPQLNGISALISQADCGKRLGLWNPMLYRFAKTYASISAPPIKDITAGNNWFYQGLTGYEPGAGLGVLDVTQFAKAVLYEAAH